MKADYTTIEKELNKIVENRKSVKAKVEKELFEQRELIEKAEENKENALKTGTKEGYLTACSKLAEEKASLEFLEEKAKQLKQGYKMKTEELRKFKKDIKKEQDSITRKGLKEIQEEIEKVCALCNEIIEEQDKGNELYSRFLKLFQEDTTTPEGSAELLKNPDLSNTPYTMIYGMNLVVGVRQSAEALRMNANKEAIKNFLEGKM